jgi:uncharacterized OB-fold protein
MVDEGATAVLLPDVDEVSRPFWEAASAGQFLLYTCDSCGARYYPATECTRCDEVAPTMRWRPASGKGRLISWIIMHRAYHDAFKGRVPYSVALVQLDEGPYFLTNIVGCDETDFRFDMPVTVCFEEISPGVTLPRFRREAEA